MVFPVMLEDIGKKIERIEPNPTSSSLIQQGSKIDPTCFLQQCWTMLEKTIDPIEHHPISSNFIQWVVQTFRVGKED